jgi:hypothetical protein
MTFEESLTVRVGEEASLAAMLTENGGWAARLDAFPGIKFQIVVDPRPQHMKGFRRVRQTTVQADVYATTRTEAASVRDRLIALLVPVARVGDVKFQRGMISAVRGGQDPEQSGERQRYRGEIARESIDFIFTHNAN